MISAGLKKPSFGATSLVILKYGSWRMHSIRQCPFLADTRHHAGVLNAEGIGKASPDLVDGARYETPDVFPAAEHVREGCGQAWSGLDSGEGDLADAVVRVEPKDAPDLVHGD